MSSTTRPCWPEWGDVASTSRDDPSASAALLKQASRAAAWNALLLPLGSGGRCPAGCTTRRDRYGVALVREAFKPDSGPLADQHRPAAEREAMANLFAGAIGLYKTLTATGT